VNRAVEEKGITRRVEKMEERWGGAFGNCGMHKKLMKFITEMQQGGEKNLKNAGHRSPGVRKTE